MKKGKPHVPKPGKELEKPRHPFDISGLAEKESDKEESEEEEDRASDSDFKFSVRRGDGR